MHAGTAASGDHPAPAQQQPKQQQQQSTAALTSAPSGASQVSSNQGCSTSRASLEGPHPSRSSLEGPSGFSSDPALRHKTLLGVRLVVQPGELVAVVGEVGAGKSSLLAALLGELMPVRGPDGVVQGECNACSFCVGGRLR